MYIVYMVYYIINYMISRPPTNEVVGGPGKISEYMM